MLRNWKLELSFSYELQFSYFFRRRFSIPLISEMATYPGNLTSYTYKLCPELIFNKWVEFISDISHKCKSFGPLGVGQIDTIANLVSNAFRLELLSFSFYPKGIHTLIDKSVKATRDHLTGINRSWSIARYSRTNSEGRGPISLIRLDCKNLVLGSTV